GVGASRPRNARRVLRWPACPLLRIARPTVVEEGMMFISWARNLFRKPSCGGRWAYRSKVHCPRAFRPGVEGLEDRTVPSFFTSPTSAAGTAPDGQAVGDFNGDGKADIAVVNQTANSLSVLLGKGDGTFGPKTDYATGTTPVGVAVGDFNGDGKLDVAVANLS